MAGLVSNDHARVAVRAFLSRNASDSGSEDGEARRAHLSGSGSDSGDDDDDPGLLKAAARPARLGLGADAHAAKPAMTEDERRIAGSIRAAASREWARVEEEGGASSSDVGYDEDSRASRLKRSTKKRKRKVTAASKRDAGKRVAPNVAADPAAERELGSLSDVVPSRAPSNIDLVKPGAARERPQWQLNLAATLRQSAEGEVLTRKRKKTRSRQKNIRRDTRSKDKLPAHLNEETLKHRLRRSDDAGCAKRDTALYVIDRKPSS